MTLLDLFAGIGVAIGARMAGVKDLGVEIDPDTIKSRELNGFDTVYTDVWDINKAEKLNFNGIWASPPCQTFSVALSHSSNVQAAPRRELAEAIHSGVWKYPEKLRRKEKEFGDPRSSLVLTPLMYVHKFDPEYLILEQVPGALNIWEAYIPHLENMGYNVWSGILNAKDFGVPQERKRAIPTATKTGDPTPNNPKLDPTTMYDALGWGLTKRPAPTVTSKTGVTRAATGTQNVYETAIEVGNFVFKPGGSTERSRNAKNGIGSRYAPGLINTTVADNKILQSFPKDIELAGGVQSQSTQLGNAVPPLVVKYLLEGLTKTTGNSKLKL